MGLTTATIVKEQLNVQGGAPDPIIERWIGWATGGMEAWACQPLEQAPVVIDFEGAGTYMERLRRWPITGVTSLTSRSIRTVGATPTTISSDAYDIVTINGVTYLRTTSTFQCGTLYTVTVTVGYPSDQIPPRLEQVCTEIVMRIARDSNVVGVGKNELGRSVVTENDTRAGVALTTELISKNPEWRAACEYYGVREL